jgi:hypothetical protein
MASGVEPILQIDEREKRADATGVNRECAAKSRIECFDRIVADQIDGCDADDARCQSSQSCSKLIIELSDR